MTENDDLKILCTDYKKRIPVVKTFVRALTDEVKHDTSLGGENYDYTLDSTTPQARQLLDGSLQSYIRTYPYLVKAVGMTLWINLVMENLPGLPVSHKKLLARSKWLLQNYKGKAKYLGMFSGLKF